MDRQGKLQSLTKNKQPQGEKQNQKLWKAAQRRRRQAGAGRGRAEGGRGAGAGTGQPVWADSPRGLRRATIN